MSHCQDHQALNATSYQSFEHRRYTTQCGCVDVAVVRYMYHTSLLELVWVSLSLFCLHYYARVVLAFMTVTLSAYGLAVIPCELSMKYPFKACARSTFLVCEHIRVCMA